MASNNLSTDRIVKQVRLEAPRSRVWRALTDADQFSQWFGVKLHGPIAPGANVSGRVTYKGYEYLTLEMAVESLEPETRFSFRWHPYAVDPSVDYSTEPTTLVEFALEDAGDGTLLTVVESGFDRIPASRRYKAFEMNSSGWAEQLENIERHLGS